MFENKKDGFKVLWNANVMYLGAKHPQEIRRGERKQLGLIPKLVNFPLIPFFFLFSFSSFFLSKIQNQNLKPCFLFMWNVLWYELQINTNTFLHAWHDLSFINH